MHNQEAELRAAEIDDMTELGTRKAQQRRNCSTFRITLHEIACRNLGIEEGQAIEQYVDPKNNMVVLKLPDEQ